MQVADAALTPDDRDGARPAELEGQHRERDDQDEQ
jgi:hypothetical protein